MYTAFNNSISDIQTVVGPEYYLMPRSTELNFGAGGSGASAIGIGDGAIIGAGMGGFGGTGMDDVVGDAGGVANGMDGAGNLDFSSLPANIIPLSVPVRNVAMGMINSKNF